MSAPFSNFKVTGLNGRSEIDTSQLFTVLITRPDASLARLW